MDVDLPAHEPGPAFTMQPTSKSELLSNALSAKATLAIKNRSSGGTHVFKVPLARSKTPLGRFARAAAGQGDSQLRLSYMSPKVSSGSRWTPTPTRTGSARLGNGVGKRGEKVEVTPKVNKNRDITDGLLDI